jgi:transcriptional antiterminator RfaH
MSRWYLIHTKPSGEATARENLVRQGYEVYLPRLQQSVRRRGGIEERVVALFPRYLFLRLEEGAQALAPVRSSIGVSGVVRFGADCAVVPESLIRQLRAREDTATGLHRLAQPEVLVSGMPIRIAMGPFDGLAGVFERNDGADRVLVLLNLLGQNTRVRLPLRSIIPGHAF